MSRLGAVVVLCVSSCRTSPTTLDRAREVLGRPGRAGELRLACQPVDAEVWLDGVPQGTCDDFDGVPRGLSVGEGLHRIDVRSQGYWPYQTEFAPGGTHAALTVSLAPIGGAKEP